MKKAIFLICCLFLLVACKGEEKQTLINQYADVLLTKNNELQFRFKFTEGLFSKDDAYRVKILIENKQLAMALGTTEVFYGDEYIHDGKMFSVDTNEDIYLAMNPIPLQVDLHTFVLEEMIRQNRAVKVEIFNGDEMIVSGFVENFQSQL